MNGNHKNGHPFHGPEEEYEVEKEWGFLTDSEDHEILMHRDAHFGGSFDVMLGYYGEGDSEKLGINPDFDIDRIHYLAAFEKECQQNLAGLLLTGPEAERVARAREGYRRFKSLYAIENEKDKAPRLIADLVLTEEEEPEAEVEAVVALGERVVPLLLEIVRSDEAYDPLFPGYGFAPYLALVVLSRLKSPMAIRPIFEVLSKETVFGDEGVLAALREIGEPSKSFLLQVLKGEPFTKDNIQAAYALSAFGDDTEVALAAFEVLTQPKNWSKQLFCSYLISLSLGLKETPHWDKFVAFAKSAKLPEPLAEELIEILQEFE